MSHPAVLEHLCIVAGLSRTGTTFLYHHLRQHPDIFAPFRKQTNFFLTNQGRGLDWYAGLFEGIIPGQYALDVSPYYTDSATVDRILALQPNARVILGVREPADFVVSLYAQLCTIYSDFMPFEAFLTHWNPTFGDGKVEIQWANGHFRHIIERYRQAFGSQILLYDYRAFAESPLNILQAIESFLEITPYFNSGNVSQERINARNRRNIRWVQYLLSREWTIGLIEKVIPRQVTIQLRALFDQLSLPKSKLIVEDSPQHQLARQRMAEDGVYYEKLFQNGSLIRGYEEDNTARPKPVLP